LADTWKNGYLVIELERLATGQVNESTAVGATLLLVLLFGEALSASDRQIGVRTIGVIIRNVFIGRKVAVVLLAQQGERGGASTSVLLLCRAITGGRADIGGRSLTRVVSGLIRGDSGAGVRAGTSSN
jgi:hypothetical protein